MDIWMFNSRTINNGTGEVLGNQKKRQHCEAIRTGENFTPYHFPWYSVRYLMIFSFFCQCKSKPMNNELSQCLITTLHKKFIFSFLYFLTSFKRKSIVSQSNYFTFSLGFRDVLCVCVWVWYTCIMWHVFNTLAACHHHHFVLTICLPSCKQLHYMLFSC